MNTIGREYADRGTFEKEVLKRNCCFAEFDVWRTLYHLSSGLDYLHALRPKQLLHRDFKPDDILVVTEWYENERSYLTSVKLADFGIAKLLNRDAQNIYYCSEYVGVPTYMAPEVYTDYSTFSEWSDVRSLGCVMAFYLNKGDMFSTLQKKLNIMEDKNTFLMMKFMKSILKICWS